MAESDTAPITLRVLTPRGVAAELRCESVGLYLADDACGRGGGPVSVLRGHAPAVMALGEGDVTAAAGGAELLRLPLRGGFASVENNVVTVLTEGVPPSGGEET